MRADYVRSDRGATAVAAYSTRARERAPVATPIGWEELTPELKPNLYTVRNLPERLAGLREDPWADMAKVRQSLAAAMRKKL